MFARLGQCCMLFAEHKCQVFVGQRCEFGVAGAAACFHTAALLPPSSLTNSIGRYLTNLQILHIMSLARPYL
jgi:hypothetical protein